MNENGRSAWQQIDHSTVVCISVAARPSNFGTTLHNAAYRALGLNYIYKACSVTDIEGALGGVRALGIRGCSVSMPFKEAVIPHLDEIEGAAETIGAVNSVVNERGRLTGYNTDWVGARISLERIEAHPGERVLLLGAGGVARAILYALRDLGFNSVRVASRDPDKVENLLPILKCQHVAWEQRGEEKPEVLINATPVGMSPEASRMPVDDGVIRACRGVLDVVVSPMETELIRRARSAGKSAVPGYLMSLHQAAAQFRLYTGVEPPMDVLQHSLEGLLQA